MGKVSRLREGGREQSHLTAEKPLGCLLALLLAGCTTAGTHASLPTTAAPTTTSPTAPPTSTSPATSISVQLILPATTMVAGSEVTGHVMVENQSGQTAHVNDCGSAFQVLLSNRVIDQQPVWPSCARPLSIPVGVSKYTVSVMASYSTCHLKGPPPVCQKDGPPPLPPGQYEANLFLSSPFAPAQPPLTVLVTG
jgi:hypothetical protein